MISAPPRTCPGEWDSQTPQGFWDKNRSPKLGQMTRPSESQQIKKRTYRIVDFVFPADHWVKLNESEKRDKILDLAWQLKKTMEHENEGDTYCNRRAWYIHQRIGKGTGGLGNKRTSGDHPNYSIVEISKKTEKSPGDLMRLAEPQTPVEDHPLILVRKTLKRGK